ncbi:hypothetical protein [Mixta intestinalis]|jgi:hypothetical protein|uniref:hypothetical protein n=1 Tax=Mixta intestinalis TaxID=1615494 RepID=UPI00136E7B82|nr:hypothetical protein [Mixta intestinalis]
MMMLIKEIFYRGLHGTLSFNSLNNNVKEKAMTAALDQKIILSTYGASAVFIIYWPGIFLISAINPQD